MAGRGSAGRVLHGIAAASGTAPPAFDELATACSRGGASDVEPSRTVVMVRSCCDAMTGRIDDNSPAEEPSLC